MNRSAFHELATRARSITMVRRLMSDQLTPVTAYRSLVAADDREAPSFLFESVEGGDRAGRWSFLGAQPSLQLVARGAEIRLIDGGTGEETPVAAPDPLEVLREESRSWQPTARLVTDGLPLPSFVGGWVGYAGYDTARYLEPEKLPFSAAPRDDRELPDVAFAFHPHIAIFDHVARVLSICVTVRLSDHPSADAAFDQAQADLETLSCRLEREVITLPAGRIEEDPGARAPAITDSTFTREGFCDAVRAVREYIAAGDAFQIVLSQRFARPTVADPFDVYRALRIVNPSPYMLYLQAPGCMLVASSPEILCRSAARRVINRPLAGTRHRGADVAEDLRLEAELLADMKDRAEHVMLVDLGRNDLGRVCAPGSIRLEEIMAVERYSHVMHLSSTVTGELAEGLDSWDLLRHTLPVGTVSGAPKVRAMQIIDELEPVRRGPYAGGVGHVDLSGDMDIAIALRTIVFPTALRSASGWTAHLQAGAGIVADSVAELEFEETVNKAMALDRAIDLAESSLHRGGES